MITTSEIRAIARVHWDDIYQSERAGTEQDLAFLDALNRADRRWLEAVRGAKRFFAKDDPQALEAMRSLAARRQAAEYLDAYRTFELANHTQMDAAE